MDLAKKVDLLRRAHARYWDALLRKDDGGDFENLFQASACKLGLHCAAWLGDVLDRLDELERERLGTGKAEGGAGG